jgi:glycine/D-amino acid oxidase-like deaminating enzyme
MTGARPAPDVAVIGGGIIGCSLAAFLAEAGLRVRLYERSAIAAGASGRNSGIVQHPFDAVLAGLYRRTLTEYRILADASDGAFALGAMPAGLLYVGRDLGLAEQTTRDWAAAWPESLPQIVSGNDLRVLEPGLVPDLVACRLDVGYPVAPASAAEAYAALARRRGVELVIGDKARPAMDGSRAVGVSLNGRVEPAGVVVVAAGPWTPELADPTGAWRPIRPSWGVVASVALGAPPRHGLEAIDIAIEPGHEDAAGSPVAGDAVEFSLVPAAGLSALGSTFLPDEPDPAAWVGALRRVGARYVPHVADAPLVALRCCARPVSLDGRPLIGRAPWADGLWIAAGHGPWGISTGPGSARLIADAILGKDAAVIPAELDARRFGSPGSPASQRQEFGSNR